MTFDPELGKPTPERLAARVARAFLGVRIDCAQCHDHPFQHWKQDDFRGLASFFGGVNSSLRGIRDGEKNEYQPPDRKTKEPVDVAPCVPFRPELKPDSGSPREQLAAWVTDPRNPNFSRRRSIASGPCCWAARWPSRSTTCRPPASCTPLSTCSPPTSPRTATTCTG